MIVCDRIFQKQWLSWEKLEISAPVILNLRQLLDGYEPIEIRRLKQKGIDIESTGDGLNISVTDARTKIIQQGDRDNVAGDLIGGNKTGT